MSLSEFEQELVDDIYNIILADDKNKGITLYGDIGSGKSTIALNLANQLKEGWTVFYIEGIDFNLSPFLTWHIGTKLHSKRKLNLCGDISFGINFLPVPVSLEFGTSINTTSTNCILSPSEEAIISNIKKQTNANQKILLIADNFEMWDVPSKQLLQKIMHPKLGVLSEYHLNALIVAQSKKSIDVSIPWKYLKIPDIPDESMLHVLRENGYAEQICIEDIRVCSGNDLSLALMAANYYSENGKSAHDFIEIMDRRCDCLPKEEQEICKILRSLSIIDSYFSKDEAAFFMDHDPKDKYKVEYLAEEYLQIAENQMFIKGENRFLFVSDKIKDYFRIKLEKKERYYHHRFSEFLKKYHSEDYYSRGRHLALSLQSFDTKAIVEAWQLLLLAYFRRSTKTSSAEDVYNIFGEIDALINRLPISIIDAQRNVLNEFINGYREFEKYNFKKALLHFQAITPSRLVPACLAECQRLILLCHIQLSEDLRMITQNADELYDTINNICNSENEQYCRAALVLLDAYIDRSNDPKKVKVLKNKIIQIIQNHIGIPEFDEFEACYNRKSALYYAAIVAYRQTEQSVQFYRKHCNRNGLYMSLCNHSGNAIVSGQYGAAKESIEECILMLSNSLGDSFRYPSHYKVENNQILLDYLLGERNAHGNREKILIVARKAVTQFSKIIEHQYDEVSHVVLFNYIGLSILCQTNTWELELTNANKLLPVLDDFYQYYLYDLNYVNALLKGDIVKAKEALEVLKTLDAPLLRHYRTILQKRQLVQEDILTNSAIINNDPFIYHEIIHTACNHVQDDSCYFWGRGFLLSDLQFLSF